MSKVILVCGRICSGKSTYTRRLVSELHAVWLSVDELLLSLFGQYLGDRHDEISARAREFLMYKSVEIAREGIPVILDFGFWQKSARGEANEFYAAHGITPEWHYIDIDDETWRINVKIRNQSILEGESFDYYIDQALAEKAAQLFETPDRDEIDVWYVNNWIRPQ